jgi:FkbM family methyltransferase
MNIYSSLKPLGFSWHNAISTSTIATRVYINLLSFFLRRIPPCQLKQRVINSINSVKWSDIELEPRDIQVVNTKFKLIPHFYEFDFEVLFNTNISYEKEVFYCLESRLISYDTIIEIGSNVGIFSIFFASYLKNYAKKTNIFVFEPSREAYLRLLKNIKVNAISNIYPFNCAISEEIDFLNFFEPEGHLTNGSLQRDFANIFSQDVRVNKILSINGKLLDKLIESSQSILIKIDVEGSEYSVLQSLKDIINSRKVDLVIEVLPAYQDKLNSVEFLSSKKYSFFNITDQGLVKYEKFVASQFRDYFLLASED